MKSKKTIRIDTFISSQSNYSRRDILALIVEGKVAVNGNVISDITEGIRPGKDTVTVDGHTLQSHIRFKYFLFNKPTDVISTLEDPSGRRCLSHYIDKIPPHLNPVGRLDRQTKGLLLFTNDGECANRILHPRYEVPKQYRVTLNHPVTKHMILRLLDGFILEDGPVKFTDIQKIDDTNLIIELHIGRNRIVRRTFEALGLTVVGLKRLKIGVLSLGNIKEGEFKELSINELKQLKLQLNLP